MRLAPVGRNSVTIISGDLGLWEIFSNRGEGTEVPDDVAKKLLLAKGQMLYKVKDKQPVKKAAEVVVPKGDDSGDSAEDSGIKKKKSPKNG
jgi:hypothetical protein